MSPLTRDKRRKGYDITWERSCSHLLRPDQG